MGGRGGNRIIQKQLTYDLYPPFNILPSPKGNNPLYGGVNPLDFSADVYHFFTDYGRFKKYKKQEVKTGSPKTKETRDY